MTLTLTLTLSLTKINLDLIIIKVIHHRKYGQKKSWHLVGFICVLISFPFIFMPCISCADSDGWAQLIYYSAFAVVFQFGWASMQISHLALIPGMTDCQNERTGLTAIRYVTNSHHAHLY